MSVRQYSRGSGILLAFAAGRRRRPDSPRPQVPGAGDDPVRRGQGDRAEHGPAILVRGPAAVL